jgi:molecular chaperone GrpE
MAEEKKPEMVKKEEYDKLLNQLKVVQADFENYKKRVEKESKDIVKYANLDLIKSILPILDTFEKALLVSKDEGFKMIYNGLKKALEKNGVKEIKTIGEKFDVDRHEAVLTVTGKGEDNIIVEEVEKGYFLHDRVARPAKVIVNKKV